MNVPQQTKFYLDKRQGKWLGVCAGISNYTGIDVSLIRILVVLGTILGCGSLLIIYIVTGLIAPAQ